MFSFLLSSQTGNRIKALLPRFEFFLVSATEVEALNDELTAVVIIINLPICNIRNASGIDIILYRVVNIKSSNLYVARVRRVNDKSNVRFTDGNEGTGSFIFLEQAILHQIIMHTNLRYGKLSQIVILVVNTILEGEAEEYQPGSTFL